MADYAVSSALDRINRTLMRIAVALEKEDDPVTVVDAALDAMLETGASDES